MTSKRQDDRQWHEVHRTMRQVDPDKMRAIGESVPDSLDGSTMLLVRNGREPVREYLYGTTRDLARAGDLAGFSVTPTPDGMDPELPDTVRSIAHPLVPWRARLNSKSTMERMRTDIGGVRESIETAMPPDSYVSVTIRRQGYFEQSRIRNWIADEHATVEDGNELVSANTMCARASVGCTRDDLSESLTKQVGQALSPMLSFISWHRSRPRFGLFAVGLAATMLSALLCAISPVDPWTMLYAMGGFVAIAFLPVLMSGVLQARARAITAGEGSTRLYYRLPIHYHAACAGLLAYMALLMLPVPWITCLPTLAFTLWAAWRWWTASVWDDIMQRPRRYWWLRRKRKANDADTETKLGVRDPRIFATGYGPQRATLILPPLTVVGLYTPLDTNGALKQDAHPVPEVLTHGGVYLGSDQTGRPCHILPEELFGGIAIFGAAGRGKSVLTHGIMQWGIAHRDDTDPKEWGMDTRIIDFEMKDDAGVTIMGRYRNRLWPVTDPRSHGRRGRVSYLADPASPCPDMLGMLDGLDARDTAANIAMAMQFAFEPGDILNDSLRVITTGMTIGVAVQRHAQRSPDGAEDIARRIRRLESQYPGAGQAVAQNTPIGWCVMALAGSDGQASSARALGQVCRALALESDDRDMGLAAKAAEQLYGRPDGKGRNRMTDQQLIQRTNASLNKVDQFLGCEHVFTTRRARITWEKVLQHPGDYHLVLSDRQMPDGTVRRLPDGMARKLGKWMLYRLWNTVKRDCQNWRDVGRHTMFVCDELSLLANADDTILREMKDQGRSFGWFNVFATQYPDQLPPLLLTSVMGYNTFITFDNPDPDMAEKTARRLTGRDGEDGWDTASVQNLPRYTAAVRTRAGDQLQPAFIVKVANFDAFDASDGEDTPATP